MKRLLFAMVALAFGLGIAVARRFHEHVHVNREAPLKVKVVKVPASDRAYMPHCDQRILHAPGECVHCDKFPEWQEARVHQMVNFTGHTDPHCSADPASARTLEHMNRWPGNRPVSEQASGVDDAYLESMFTRTCTRLHRHGVEGEGPCNGLLP